MAQAKSVSDIYKSVVNDVIEGVKEAFMEDSIDETILQELRQLWESKLAHSKAVEPPEHDVVYTRPTPAVASMANTIQIKQQQQPMATQIISPIASAVSATSHPQQQPIQGQIFNITPAHQLVSRAVRLPVQTNAGQTSTITLPVQGAGAFQQHLTSLQYLVPNQPGQFLIQTPNGARLIQSQQGLPPGAVLTVAAPSTSTGTAQGIANKSVNQSIIQLDGLNDSSSEDEEEEEEEEDEEQNDENDDAQGEEEDPLCSDDDISDTDPTEVFDAENVVVCQFDKINRSKNKWKFHLKDGIMNLNGKDHVFQKANGDAEW